VTENDVPQPRIEVYLIDPKSKHSDDRVKNKMKTNADGTYAFTELDPGLYRVDCDFCRAL
jgi:hypothetical protein